MISYFLTLFFVVYILKFSVEKNNGNQINAIAWYLNYRTKTNALILFQDKKSSTTVNTSANGLYKHLNVHIVVDFGEAFQYRV